MAHKRNLKKGTRIDLKKPKQHYWKIQVQKAWLKIFMLSWLFWICFWKFNHKQFNVLENFWRWNYTKTMHQLIVINFSKSLSNYRIFWRQDALFFYFIYHFFSILSFHLILFFSWFYNTSNCINPYFQNFFQCI